MACLPDADNERNTLGETAGTDQKEKRQFGAGFLTGCLLTLLCVLVFMLGWLLAQRTLGNRDGSNENPGAAVLTDSHTLSKLDEVQTLIEQDFLDEVDSDTLSAYLFRGVAAGLQDDYAGYYSAQELQSLREATKGEYFGIGATLTFDGESRKIRVLEVYEGSPARESGLQEGDILMAVDDTSLEGVSLSDTVSMIKSREEPFVLKVYRPDTEETLELSMACGEVELTYARAEMKPGRIGYIRITEFTESAVGQFRDCVEELQEQGMEKLIVDLRGNPGGLLNSVCDILDEILPEKLLVYTENKDGKREEYYSDEKQFLDCPVAVLVNGDSASASEIFAGAVQDWELGPVIGTQTYGKGVVQKTFTLSDGSAIKFTVSKYYTPKGQDIDGNGITPDIVVEEVPEDAAESGTQADNETEAQTEQVRETEAPAEQAKEPEQVIETETPAGQNGQELQAQDPVLEKALEVLNLEQ